jgi:predicted dehydrogenase
MSGTTERCSVGLLGAGYWGRNYVRNFAALAGCELRWVCDRNPPALTRAARVAPSAKLTPRYLDLLEDETLDAVVVASEAPDHYAHTKLALEHDKHVLVEKPLATGVAQAEELQILAQRRERTLMVGHLLLYHPAVLHLHRMIAEGALGRIFYLHASRVNLGRVRSEENVLWSFGPHDLATMLYLLDEAPLSVTARGQAFLQPGVADVVFCNLSFSAGVTAQIRLSWIDPRKQRELTIVGSRQMVVFDDTHATEKLRIYDKGFKTPPEYNSYGDFLSIRGGDIHIPQLSLEEPLSAECRHFISCIRDQAQPRSDGQQGLDVVRILDAAERSMAQDGAPVAVR